MHCAIHSLVREASMCSKKGKQKGITADSIRQVTEVGMQCDLDVTKEG